MRLTKFILLFLTCALVIDLGTAGTVAEFKGDDVTRAVVALDQPGESSAAIDVRAAAAPDAAAPAKKRGNGFLRALGAPFRALGRLFGGGRKKDTTARRAPATPQPTQVAAAPAQTTNVAPEERAQASKPAKQPKESKEAKEQKQARVRPQIEPRPTPQPVIESAKKSERNGKEQKKEKRVRPEIAGGNTPTFTEQPAPTKLPALMPPQPSAFLPFVEGVARDPLAQGRALLEHGQTTEAIAQLSVAAVTGPDLIAANNLLGLAYDRLGNHEQAQDAYERALTAAPEDAATLNNLGYSLYLSERNKDALARLKQAARLDAASPHIANNLALVYSRLGKFDDAFKNFARAGGEFYARVQTAALYEAAGRDRDAIKHFEAARKLEPANAEILRRLIDLYVRTGQPGKAEDARQLLEAMPADKRGDGTTLS